MADLLSGGVMKGLMAAAGTMNGVNSAMKVYTHAKATNDEAMMKRAFGRATEGMSSAMKSTHEAGEALEENIKAKREEDKAERGERIEEKREEAAEKRTEQQEHALGVEREAVMPDDTVEISPAGVSASQSIKTSSKTSEGDVIIASHHSEKTASIKRVHRSSQVPAAKAATGNKLDVET